MEIKEVNKRPISEQNKRLNRRFVQFEKLISELRSRSIPNEIVNAINTDIEQINVFPNSEKDFRRLLKKTQSRILKLVDKELKLVPVNHYRNNFMGIGIAMGVALGAALGSSSGNSSMISIGIPIGMVIGMAILSSKYKKEKENGLQLDLEIRY